MRITELNQKQLHHFASKGCARPSECYANCTRIVYAHGFGNYVLCQIEEVNGNTHGHAVIEFNGEYYDPTLQQNSNLTCKYRHVKTFSRQELIDFMKEHGACFEDGKFSGYPPALLADGSIGCLDVPLNN